MFHIFTNRGAAYSEFAAKAVNIVKWIKDNPKFTDHEMFISLYDETLKIHDISSGRYFMLALHSEEDLIIFAKHKHGSDNLVLSTSSSPKYIFTLIANWGQSPTTEVIGSHLGTTLVQTGYKPS